MGVPEGEEWDPFATVADDPDALKAFLAMCRSSKGAAPLHDARLAVESHCAPDDREISTQAGFGKILDTSPRATAPGRRAS
jgi:pyruvate dehydrogenase E1 component